ncbi:MAG: hypothetical protein Q9160_000336 [Pyrenula sp. 1 TL-2023]
MSTNTHNIVVIGGSFAGLPVAHTVLKTVIPTLNSSQSYKVFVLSPNAEFYWKVGAPRSIVNPKALPEDKAFLSIAEGFKKYDKSQFEHIKAFATSIDPSNQTISYSDAAQGPVTSTLHYDSLVLASGTSFKDPVWSVQQGEAATKQALHEIHTRLEKAETIVIAGGGAAGVETAGELGSLYGKSKRVTLLSGAPQLLSRLQNPAVGMDAQAKLEKMGIEVVHNVRIESSTKDSSGRDALKMNDGTERVVDVHIEATGDAPNNTFIPKDWLNEKGFVKTDTPTLRADIPGVKNVYVLGSIGSYSKGGIPEILFGYKVVCESIRVDLAGETDGPKRKKVFKPMAKDMQMVPIGPGGGVATAFGWRFPNFVVAMAKSKTFMVEKASGYVDGTGP